MGTKESKKLKKEFFLEGMDSALDFSGDSFFKLVFKQLSDREEARPDFIKLEDRDSLSIALRTIESRLNSIWGELNERYQEKQKKSPKKIKRFARQLSSR